MRRSIPTRFNGILFRSKLEADWARALTALEIPYEYEKEGRYFGETFYLVDFWLPQSRQFLEVKGIIDDKAEEKRRALLAAITPEECPEVCFAYGLPGGAFRAYTRTGDDIYPHLTLCPYCVRWSFTDDSTVCQVCLQSLMTRRGTPVPRIWHYRFVDGVFSQLTPFVLEQLRYSKLYYLPIEGDVDGVPLSTGIFKTPPASST